MRLVIRDLIPGKNYNLQFRSKDATGTVSAWSRTFQVNIAALDTKPAVPDNISLVSSGDSFVARWNIVNTSVTGAILPDVTGYTVEFTNMSTGQKATFETTDTSFELTYNLNYAAFTPMAGRLGVRIAAKTIYSQSDWSTQVIAQNPAPNPVKNLQGQSILGGIAVTWDQPDNLESDFLEYRAYAGTSADFTISPDNMFWSGIGTNATYYMSLQNNYYIKVVAVDKFESASTESMVGPFTPKSTTDADATAPSTPTGLNGSISGNTLTVNWTKVSDPDVVGYRIAYRPAGTTVWSYATAGRDDSSSIIQPIDLYRNYEVQVWAHDNSFNYSNPTSILGVTAPADTGAGSVTGIALEAGVNTAIATWTPVNSSLLKNYEIQFANVPLTSETVGTISSVFGSRHDFAGLVPGTYYARIRTVSVGGVKGAWSGTAQATIAKGDGKAPSSSPTPTVMDGIAAIYATWPEISNVDLVSYEVHASATSGFTPSAGTRIGDTSGTVMSIRGFANGTPLTAGTPYYIRIVAKDADGAAAAGAQAGPAKLSQAATQSDLNNLTSTVNKSLKTTTVEYAVNTSETSAPTSGWSTATPTRTAGQFIWYRTTLSYNDGTTAVTNPALLTGNTGATGPAGAAGATTYTWIKYADTPTTGMSDLPDGKTYMGIATNKSTATESSTYSDYQWSLIKGAQGIPGPAGADGTVYYTWIKYAADANGTNLSDDPTGRPYLGIAYNKTTATESTNAADYSWSLIQGAAGAQGPQGIPGPAGTNGASLYTWLKYADTPTTGMSDSPTGKTYMGIAYNKTSSTESSNYADYEWSLIQGAQGIPGPAGANGQPTYTWVKYANDASGSGMSDDPTGKTYLGLAYNKTTATESTVATDYSWSLIQGPQGAQGPQGIAGSAGTTYYTWLKYASSTTPAAADMSDSPTGKTYMGIAVNKTTATESTVYTDYTWSLIKGDQGVPGPAGANGQTTYTWVKYANDASGTGLSDDPTGKTYIGLATNKTTATESTTATDYTWSLFQGPQGVAGPAGAAAASVSLTASTQVLSLAAGATATNPTTSTVTGTSVNTTITQWLYAVDGGAFSTTVPAGVSRSGNVVTITGQTMTAKVVTVKMADANNVSDTLSVVKVSDGATGATGATGPAGTAGADGYTVILTNEAQVFAGTATTAQAGTANAQVIAYKGGTQMPATIGTITGMPTGMTVALTNNGTTTAGFTVTVTTALTQKSGTLTVPITVDGKAFTSIFSWSISFSGATGATGPTGATGANGVGVSSVTPYYLQQASATAAPAAPTTNPPPAPWTTTEPAYAANTSLYRTDRVVYTNSTFAYTAVSKMSAYQAADLALTTANNKNKITYSTGVPGTTANTAGDIWFQKDANNVIIAQWEGAGGTSWIPKTLGNSVIANLDAGKITTGYLDAARLAAGTITAGSAIIADAAIVSAKIASLDANKITAGTGLIANLTVKSTLTMGDASTNGIIQSYGYNGANGYYMDKSQLIINNGSVAAAALRIQFGQNIIEPLFADFEGQVSYYNGMPVSSPTYTTATIVSGGYFGSQALQFMSNGTAPAGTWTGVRLTNDINKYAIPVEAGKTYIVSMYVKGTAVAMNIVSRLVWQDGTYADAFNVTTTPNQAYTRYSGVVTVPAGKTNARVEIWTPTVAANAGVIVDAVQVEERIGALNTPSSWTPPSSTSIDGGMIRTGEIRSNQTIIVNGVAQPMWSINMNGGAQFGSALIRGSLTVGTTGDADGSYIISANYNNTPGTEAGFLLRGSDGYASFRKVDISLDTSVSGNITVGDKSAKYTTLNYAGLVSYVVNQIEGNNVATPTVYIGSPGVSNPVISLADTEGNQVVGMQIENRLLEDGVTQVQKAVLFGEELNISSGAFINGQTFFNGSEAGPEHLDPLYGPVINGQALFADSFLEHFERHPGLGSNYKWNAGHPYGVVAFGKNQWTATQTLTGTDNVTREREYLKVRFTAQVGRLYRISLSDIQVRVNSDSTRAFGEKAAYVNVYRSDAGATDVTLANKAETLRSYDVMNTNKAGYAFHMAETDNYIYLAPGIDGVPAGDLLILVGVGNTTGTNLNVYAGGKVVIEDIGRNMANQDLNPQGLMTSTTYSSTGTAPAPVVKEYTKTYAATWDIVYSPHAINTSYSTNRLIAGDSDSGNEYRSYIGFPNMTADLSGATIKKVEFYYYKTFQGGTGRYTAIGFHDQASKPTASTDSAFTILTTNSVQSDVGASKWVSITNTTAWAGLKSGAYRGVMMGRRAHAKDAERWAEFYRYSHSSYYPRLRITYTK